MRVHRLAIVDDGTAEHLWKLYERAFAPLETLTAMRQTLHRDEFFDQMRDPRIWKYLGHDEEGDDPIALVTLTRHLETDPWVNPQFFAHRWPQEYAEGRIYYLGFLMVHPERQRHGHYNDLLRPLIATAARERWITGFDAARHNDEVLGLVQSFLKDSASQVTADLTSLDAQSYYAITLRPLAETEAPAVIDLAEAGAGRPNR